MYRGPYDGNAGVENDTVIIHDNVIYFFERLEEGNTTN